jgi:DNA-binding protein H-NS
MKTDVSQMTAAELKKLIADAEKALRKLEDRRLAEAKKAVEKAAKQYGFAIEELVSADGAPKPKRKPRARKTTKGPKGVVKFRNPANPEQTWTGKGRKPNWINEGLAAGKTLDDFAI